MTQKIPNLPPVTGFMRQFSLSILLPFIKKPDSQPASFPQFDSSVFSRPDQSELLAMEEEICPLVEAEVYLIYGRKADAEKVLAQGVRTGRITTREVAQFWSNQGNASGRMATD
ncbi:MAG: hypothetical protein FD131_276 [Rhodocyclaceae bacterium]|nr:MAG: hypothetical protein FD131_276 [Rhodocyclaceae bacterium]